MPVRKKRYRALVPLSKRKDWKSVNHMSTQTNRQLALGHAILHAWARDPRRTNWTRDAIEREHERLVKIMKKRGFKHTTQLKFSKAWEEIPE